MVDYKDAKGEHRPMYLLDFTSTMILITGYDAKHEVRTITKDGELWVVAEYVCDILGLTDSRKSVALLDEDERNTVPVIDALGRAQDTNIINEPGPYRLTLHCRSRTP